MFKVCLPGLSPIPHLISGPNPPPFQAIVVRLADVVAGVRRTAKKRRGGRIEIDAMNTKSCFSTGEKKQGQESDSDRSDGRLW